MYYKCLECDGEFEEYELDSRMAELEDCIPRGTKLYVCPVCGSTALEEMGECARCGRPVERFEDLCEDCKNEFYELVSEYRDDLLRRVSLKEANNIVSAVMERWM